MINPNQVETMIKAQIPDAHVQVASPDGEHYEVTVVSAAFEGKGLVQQHQLVFRAVQQELLSGDIHAMALKTYTPQSWATAGQVV
jgi:acid stress-induced BolA-like protein IbaG/YrbA